jgi:ADP-heptose:LPS heptosyltransferase
MRFESDVYDVTVEEHLKADVDYIIPRELIRHYASASDGHMSIERYQIGRPFNKNLDWNGKRILIHRSGSAGDLLFITPLLRELKAKWPQCQIVFNCEQRYRWVLEHNPHVDQCVSPPLVRETVEAFDAQIDLESASEFSPLAKTHILTEVYASVADIELSDIKTLYSPLPAVAEKVKQRFPKTNIKRVGISLLSDSVIRDYPYSRCLEVIGALMKANIQVVLLGKSATGVKSTPLFIDLAGEKPSLTWEESTAFMQTCDLVLGPDSSAIHFAGAMGIPSLGLFGPFLAKLRIPSQPATQAIQGIGPCAPCFHHGRANSTFPPNGPCKLSGHCDVLAAIPPQQVLAKIFEMLGGVG